MKCGESRESGKCSLGFREMSNVQEDSGKYSRRFRVILEKISRNVPENSGKFYQRFQEMFEKFPGNIQDDLGKCFQFYINQSRVLLKIIPAYLKIKQMLK